MKTRSDPRHVRRRKTIQILFAQDFLPRKITNKTAVDVIKNMNVIDKKINTIAPTFPVEKINKIDLAILRLAIFELLFDKSQPPKVIVDEAIELAKEFGGESSPGFINGALGNLLKSQKNF